MGLMKFQPTLLHLRLELFDAVEIHPVREDAHGCEQIDISEWGRDPRALYFWSVYLHYDSNHPECDGFGGIACVADLRDEEAAQALAEGLAKVLVRKVP
jgi:hypothetical protein